MIKRIFIWHPSCFPLEITIQMWTAWPLWSAHGCSAPYVQRLNHLSIELIPKATEINSSYMSHLLMVKSMWYVYMSVFFSPSLQHWAVLPDWPCLDYNHQGDGHLIGSWPLSHCIGHSSTGQLDGPAGVCSHGGGSVMIFSVSVRYTRAQQDKFTCIRLPTGVIHARLHITVRKLSGYS